MLVVLKRLPPGHPTAASCVAMAIGSPLMLGFSALAHEQWALPVQIETWLSLGYLVFGAAVNFQLGLFVVGRWTASAVSYSFLLTPLVTVVAAAIILAEPIRVSTIIGGALIVGGVWLGAFSASSLRAPDPAPAELEPEAHVAPA